MSTKKSNLGLIELTKLMMENKISITEYSSYLNHFEDDLLSKLKSSQQITFPKKEEQERLNQALDVIKNILDAIVEAKKFVKDKGVGHLETCLVIFNSAKDKALVIHNNTDKSKPQPKVLNSIVSEVTAIATSDDISIKSGNIKSFSFEKTITFTPKPRK